jgi:hypothetical protein
MKSGHRRRKGQFSIVAALLIAIIMVSAVIMTYSTIRNLPFQESPQVLSSIEEMNLSLKQLLEFAVGYYGSILQVTGNVTYAKDLTSKYVQSGFVYIAHSHPEWNPSFEVNYLDFSTRWYEPSSYSIGNLSATYSLAGLGVSQINYKTSTLLNIEVLETVSGRSKVRVTREDGKPDLTLRRESFFFYNYSDSTWKLIGLTADPTVFANGTYILQIPSGVEQSSYLIKVSDFKGTMATAFFSNSRKPQYTYTFTWNSSLYSPLTKDTVVVEALQNGTVCWLGQNLKLSTRGKPIPPLPVRALHVNQTINGINREVPFQVEDWGSKYKVPLGLTSNASLFGDRQMIVFLSNHNVQKVTLWWDGRDTVKQTPYAWKNRYFNDDPDADPGVLNNGILRLNVYNFRIEATAVGGSLTSTAEFLRINNQPSGYGSGKPAYVIYNGIIRDIIQQEAEWSNGITNCPNVYSQIFVTLPANATYYTYAARLVFINSSQSRTITDLSTIQLSSDWMSQTTRSLTENRTSSGFPIIGETFAGQNMLFYNFSSPTTGWAHHWSEFVSGNAGGGIMFTDSANAKLYAFDKIANQRTGALSVTMTQRTTWTTPTGIYSKCGQDSYNPATYAIDGSTSTYWLHSTTENHWITLDLGTTMNITEIRVFQSYTSSQRWGQSNGVEVYVSNDPNNWGTAIWTGRLDSGSGWQESGTFSAQGRYVKLRSLSTSSSQRLYEVQVQTSQKQVAIEFDPVNRYQASFTYSLDVTWHGAVPMFMNEPIYPTVGNIGLWVIVEYPPTLAVD